MAQVVISGKESAVRSSILPEPLILTLAWAITLAVSVLPNIIWNELLGGAPEWLFGAKMALLAAALAATFAWQAAYPLRSYLIVLLALSLIEWGIGALGGTPFWISLFPVNSPFVVSMLGTQLLRLGVALCMLGVMFAIKRRREAFFLVKGKLDATAAPIPFLMTRPTPWTRLGLVLSVCVSLGLLAFLVLAGAPAPSFLLRALPLLPAVLFFALLNSFSEEFNYRASLLSTLEGVTGKDQSLLLTAAFFGLGHYYGVPYGLIGVLMAGFLGWLLGKSMLETRGFSWAWFIHLLQDVLVFSFMAIGSVTPGGR